MKDTASIILKVFTIAIVLLQSVSSYAQDSDVKNKSDSKEVPSMNKYLEETKQPHNDDIDVYFGKVIKVENNTAIVRVTSPSKMSDRIPIYYVCDTAMRPTAILSDMRINHKSCAAFKIEEGKVEVGDLVMVKHKNISKNK